MFVRIVCVVFCVSQTGGGTKSDVQRLGEVVRTIGHTLAFLDPFDDPVPLGTSRALAAGFGLLAAPSVAHVPMSDRQANRGFVRRL